MALWENTAPLEEVMGREGSVGQRPRDLKQARICCSLDDRFRDPSTGKTFSSCVCQMPERPHDMHNALPATVHVHGLNATSDKFFQLSEPVGSNAACWKSAFCDVIKATDASRGSARGQMFWFFFTAKCLMTTVARHTSRPRGQNFRASAKAKGTSHSCSSDEGCTQRTSFS